MTLKHPMPTIRHNPQRSTINHNKLTNYPPQCIPHTYGCTIANTVGRAQERLRRAGPQRPAIASSMADMAFTEGAPTAAAEELAAPRHRGASEEACLN